MTAQQQTIIYDSHPERELEIMWQQINEKDTTNLNRSLLKAIAQKEDGIKTTEIPLYTKQMFDNDKGEWVSFDMWGAHYIINNSSEPLQMRMRMPLPNQNEFGEILSGWKSYDSSYLQKSLKDKTLKDKVVELRPNNAISTELQHWLAMVRQERQAYKDEGRYSELSGYDENVGY